MNSLARLSHRADIQDVMYRYARGVDRRDWAAVRACFHDGATDHHGDFHGPIDDFVAWVGAMHEQVPFSAHILGNMLIEFASDGSAAVETYFNAALRLDAISVEHRKMLVGEQTTATEIDMDVIGRYLDHFLLREDRWRIAKRQVAFDAVRVRPAMNGTLKPEWVVGRRGSSDPVYAWRTMIGVPGQ
ncbi:MAG: nuclear transport factor 2 family protein [Gammaproteobacteria bacterium]